MIAKKASKFVGRFADIFSRGLCLGFVCSLMALRVAATRTRGFEWCNIFFSASLSSL